MYNFGDFPAAFANIAYGYRRRWLAFVSARVVPLCGLPTLDLHSCHACYLR